MAFTEKLPEWHAEGIEPPDSKKQTGWEVEDKPPAGWWNWLLNRTFKAIEELRNKAADKQYVDDAVAGAKVPDASLTQKGITQLSSATNSTSENMAATPKAVKAAYDRGSEGVTAAANAQAKADAAETPAGAQSKANAAETNAKNYVDVKPWQKVKVTADDGKCILLPNGTNLNTVIKNGFYNGSSLVNAPTATDWWYIEVLEHTNGDLYAIQKAYPFYYSGFFTRVMQNGVWGPWSADLFQSGVDAKNGVAGAVNAKGGNASGSMSWGELNNAILALPSGGEGTLNINAVLMYADPNTTSYLDLVTLPGGTRKFLFAARNASNCYLEGRNSSTATIIEIEDSLGRRYDTIAAYSGSTAYLSAMYVDRVSRTFQLANGTTANFPIAFDNEGLDKPFKLKVSCWGGVSSGSSRVTIIGTYFTI
ncbi:pyocin knob domain-containing protein [Paenibacillus sp. KQZ6P-2]|uniref:Pyocin knob domain-containing protein n=1 Tax=Paenibacillus mangrovi TaxID=2931978 RepID=A0A9X1WVA7_9BACL|nr:pyocin knob domain-containing protein [Paenibacillus mangrovi]MCJ8015216.1 pyocin knob domain-containing protein [Paenibacillus mangrovi]